VLAGLAGASALGGAGSVAAQDALEPNSWEEITSYNNFYEFGTGKTDPATNAGGMVTDPWNITIDGMVDNPGTFALNDLISDMTMEERLYRFRCVEAWAMVIPWNGFELPMWHLKPQSCPKSCPACSAVSSTFLTWKAYV